MKKFIFLLVNVLLLTSYLWSSNGPIQIKAKTNSSYLPKGLSAEYISASLSGNTVTVSFSRDFGPVEITVETVSGNFVGRTSCLMTPEISSIGVSGTGAYVLIIETAYGVFTGNFIVN